MLEFPEIQVKLALFRFLMAISFVILPGLLSAQFLSNPSFEGTPAMHTAPPGWTTCHERSTPDTQPGQWGTTLSPSDGDSYVSMVSRGNWGGNANTTEDIQAKLLKPFRVDDCYTFKIDLATCEACGHDADFGWLSYANPVKLRIWGGTDECEKSEILAETEAITHFNWETYEFLLIPTAGTINYIILEVIYTDLPEYFGTIYIDNIRIGTVDNTFIMLDLVVNDGDIIELHASEGATYNWIPGSGLSCSDCPAPLVSITGSMSYVVIIRDTGECSRKEIFNLWLESFVFVPNAFSPNFDGLNDHFGPVFRGNYVDMDFRIFNRWGEEVFYTRHEEHRWNGEVKGGAAPPGIYTWLLDYRVYEFMGVVKKRKKGMVYLLR